ncbi:MAG: hypothetical protein H7328_01985 [Bdellovibrio sp.]|nr:hypothetical protein [Bdellovibrio sp.]
MRFLGNLFLLLFFSITLRAQEQTLVDYAKPGFTFNVVEDTKTESLQKNSFKWLRSYIGLKKDVDASAFDSLLISFTNPQNRAINLNLEIKDAESKDYWSRVNYYLSVPPGESEIRVPLKLRVGDNSRPGRALNLAKLNSIILARVDNPQRPDTLFVKKLILKKEMSIIPQGIYGFDFGGEETPVFPGFTGVHAKSLYSPATGFGLINAEIWQPYPHANDSLQPDSLYRDALFIPRGTFQVDVPNGEYQIILNLDFSSGYWGEFPLFKKRNVLVQGKEVLHLSLNRNQAADRYFEFSEITDHESDHFFQKYYSKIFREHLLEAKVIDGHLKIQFEGDNCAENACFGMAVNSLIIIPKHLEESGAAFLEKLLAARQHEFSQKFTFLPSAAASKTISPVKDLLYFSWPITQEMPEKISAAEQVPKDLELTLLKGQLSSLSFGLLAPENLEIFLPEIKTKKIEPAIKLWPVARRLTRTQPAGNIYTVAERYLLEKKSVLLTKNEAQRIWLEVDTRNSSPGGYNFEVVVKYHKKEIKIPIKIKVLDLVLPAVDFPVGPFNSTIQEAWWFENQYRDEVLQQKSFTAMEQNGLTTASFFARLEVDWDKKPLEIKNIERITKLMHLARSHKFLSLTAYNSVFAYQDLCRGQFSEADLKNWVQVLDRESLKKNWLLLNILVCDEPVGDELPAALKRTQVLQNFSTARIQFSSAFSYDEHAPEFKEFYTQSKLPFLGLFSYEQIKSEQKKWVFYNSANRASFGFGLFKLRETTALQARIAWNWNQNAGNPYFALDAREDDVNWCNSLRDGDLQCSVFLKRHILEGLNDYRLARMLKQTNFKNTVLKAEATRLLAEIKSKADISSEIAPGDLHDHFTQEQKWRNQIFSLLERMVDETKVKAKIK